MDRVGLATEGALSNPTSTAVGETRCRPAGETGFGGASLTGLLTAVALVPPRGLHLTCFHGVFAPNVIDDGKLVGAITRFDILRVIQTNLKQT